MLITASSAAGLTLVETGIVLTPGPNMLYLISRSLGQGRRAALVSLIGTQAGFLVYMTLANFGLAGVFAADHWVYRAVALAGACYLLRLAWKAARPGGAGVFEQRDLPAQSPGALLRMGLLTNLLNPKAAMLYLALIPQFVNPARGHVLAQGFALGLLQIAESTLDNIALITAASAIAAFLATRPGWLRWQSGATGAMLAVIALDLALSGLL